MELKVFSINFSQFNHFRLFIRHSKVIDMYKISRIFKSEQHHSCLLFDDYNDMENFLDQNYEKYQLVSNVPCDLSEDVVWVVMNSNIGISDSISRENVFLF